VGPAGQFSIHVAELASIATGRPSPLPPKQGLVYLLLIATGAGMTGSASVGVSQVAVDIEEFTSLAIATVGKMTEEQVLCCFAPITKGSFVDSG
jgi:hypothetical protein